MRVTPEQVDQLLHPQFSAETKQKARKEGALLVHQGRQRQPRRRRRHGRL